MMTFATCDLRPATCDLRPATYYYPHNFAHLSKNLNVMMALKNGVEYSWIRVGGCGKLGRMSALLLFCPPYVSSRYSMSL
jgi:hypothetical protein